MLEAFEIQPQISLFVFDRRQQALHICCGKHLVVVATVKMIGQIGRVYPDGNDKGKGMIYLAPDNLYIYICNVLEFFLQVLIKTQVRRWTIQICEKIEESQHG